MIFSHPFTANFPISVFARFFVADVANVFPAVNHFQTGIMLATSTIAHRLAEALGLASARCWYVSNHHCNASNHALPTLVLAKESKAFFHPQIIAFSMKSGVTACTASQTQAKARSHNPPMILPAVCNHVSNHV
jgi:hypothetical protein